jgi:hypothetical protein
MSAIKTTISVKHLASGVASSNAASLESNEESFSLDSIVLTTSDVALTPSNIITPKDYFIRNLSGDDVLISLDNDTTYPLAVKAGESQLISLDVEGNREISTIVAVADVAGSTAGLYFDLTDRSTFAVRVWLNDGVVSAPSTPASGRLLPVTTVTNATAIQNAVAIAAAIDADDEFSAPVPTTALVTITDQHVGTRTNISAGTTTWTVATPQQGAALPIVTAKSRGTSQAQIMVLPN